MIEENKKMKLVTKIITFVLIAIFTIRLGIYQQGITSHIGLNSNNIGSNGLTAICLILIWFENACILMLICRRWFNFKILRNILKFIAPIVFILNSSFVMPISKLLIDPIWAEAHSINVTLFIIIYIIETTISLGLCIYYFFIDFNEKNNWKEILSMLGLFLLMLIPALPTYFVQYMFGYSNAAIEIKELTVYHRIFIYLGFIIPFSLYFALRNKPQEVIRFAMIYMSTAAMIGFVVYYNYQTLATPWAWPIHLCNTAMFLVPLCLIFKMKKLFYFTYFINVFGAFCAMLMPNYNDLTNVFSDRIFQFWFNHWIAFFMPVLLVSLNVFERPKLKQFKWSMLWFAAYFVIALTLNVLFTAMGHDVDYFFLNTNFIADKLGDWANKLFNIVAEFKIGDLTLTFHPIYQFLYFICYVLLGLGMWFVYAEFYRIGDSHIALHNRLKKIKQDEIAVQSKLSVSMKEELMNNNYPASFKLDHFSKRYASSKTYSVEDANLEVHAGEIFGFLGPNGAGKSTIIKSTVGIQTITSGHINICGYDVATEPVLSKYNIGYVPDHYALYEKLTGREYINYIADIYEVSKADREERIEKYIKLFELQGSIDNKIKTYSHGMKQKITIMAALVHNPKVWILDEPLTGLDPNSIYQVKECMRQHAAAGNIVFFSSHIIDIVEKLCGRIAIIKKGHIQCVKTVKEIEDSGESLEDFYLRIINGDNADDFKESKVAKELAEKEATEAKEIANE